MLPSGKIDIVLNIWIAIQNGFDMFNGGEEKKTNLLKIETICTANYYLYYLYCKHNEWALSSSMTTLLELGLVHPTG